jgi:hypothetical protein
MVLIFFNVILISVCLNRFELGLVTIQAHVTTRSIITGKIPDPVPTQT